MLELLIVSPSTALGDGLSLLARKSQVRVTTAATIEEFLRVAEHGDSWGLVVIDDLCLYTWDDMIIRTVARLQIRAKRILLAEPYLTSEVAFYIAQGLHGVLNKRAGLAELLDGCLAVAAGQRVVDLPWKTRLERVGTSTRLTARQCEILGLVASGCSNKGIAFRLGCTENTVKAHLRTIYRVLGVHTRIECLQMAHRNGWIGNAITRK